MLANKLLAEIHNVKRRMVAYLAKEDRDAWLTGTLTADPALSAPRGIGGFL
jgi:putative SOS response-associated peptidase YedK